MLVKLCNVLWVNYNQSDFTLKRTFCLILINTWLSNMCLVTTLKAPNFFSYGPALTHWRWILCLRTTWPEWAIDNSGKEIAQNDLWGLSDIYPITFLRCLQLHTFYQVTLDFLSWQKYPAKVLLQTKKNLEISQKIALNTCPMRRDLTNQKNQRCTGVLIRDLILKHKMLPG